MHSATHVATTTTTVATATSATASGRLGGDRYAAQRQSGCEGYD
jgi:hypothetical protein